MLLGKLSAIDHHFSLMRCRPLILQAFKHPYRSYSRPASTLQFRRGPLASLFVSSICEYRTIPAGHRLSLHEQNCRVAGENIITMYPRVVCRDHLRVHYNEVSMCGTYLFSLHPPRVKGPCCCPPSTTKIVTTTIPRKAYWS